MSNKLSQRIKKIRDIDKLVFCLFFTCLFVYSNSPATVNALIKEQKELHQKNIQYFDINSCDDPATTGDTPAAAPAPAPAATGNSVYMLGDSITVGSKDLLESGLEAKGDAYINASGSRSIKGAGQTTGFKTSGLDAAEGDKERINAANTVVIALGTNQEANFEGAIRTLITNIKGYDTDNSGLQIYWVNVFSPGGSSGYGTIDRGKINDSIDKMAASEGFKVINTVGKITAADLSDSVHPKSPEGTRKFADVVIAGVGGNAAQANTAVGNNCACGPAGSGSTSDLVGSENEEKIFNFLVGKGLTAVQAAGVVGNFSVESAGTFDPFIQEIGKTPPIGGHGIAQWTGTGRPGDPAGARRLNMVKAMQAAGLSVDLSAQLINKSSGNEAALAAQLDYLWEEATDRGDIAKLKTETTVKGAVESWLVNFEVAGIPHTEARVSAGQAAMVKYGSGTPSAPTGSPGAPAAPACAADEAAPGAGSPGGVFAGSGQEAAKALLNDSGVTIHDDRALVQAMADGQSSPLDEELIKMLASLAINHTFGISSLYRGPCANSNHCTGKAADINPTIDGVAISYTENNPKIQKFIDDAAKLLGTTCENGVPNQAYVDKTRANGSKCGVFVDRGSGPHIHLAVAP